MFQIFFDDRPINVAPSKKKKEEKSYERTHELNNMNHT
jgi:hypothetical protein